MGALPRDQQPEPVRLASFSPRRVTIYRDTSEIVRGDLEHRDTDANLTRGIFNGYISPATRRHIRRTVGTWIRSVWIYRGSLKRKWDPGKPYLVFITLTLPSAQVHDDRVIRRECLDPWIKWMKRAHGITHYFWRAEAQVNGNLHYHVLVDRYIAAEDLQVSWIKAVNRLGYVDRYFDESGSAMPPCTDVHRITDKVRDPHTGELRTVDPVEYLLDYVTDTARPTGSGDLNAAQDQGANTLRGRYRRPDGTFCEYEARPVQGRIWGMSDALRDLREPRCECDARIYGSLKRAVDRGALRLVEHERCSMFFGPVYEVIGASRGWLRDLLQLYHLHVFAHLYPDHIPPWWIVRHGRLSAVDLWIDVGARAVRDRGGRWLRGSLEYEAEGEPMWITEVRRALSNVRIVGSAAERLCAIARKYLA